MESKVNVIEMHAIVHFGTLGTSTVVHIGSHGKQRVNDPDLCERCYLHDFTYLTGF